MCCHEWKGNYKWQLWSITGNVNTGSITSYQILKLWKIIEDRVHFYQLSYLTDNVDTGQVRKKVTDSNT